ncbi:MFS general substrate transporter [Dichomitus squalens LYAD-421 SS1]|uniref:MFS general substrate transporter n=1 Tax=Dichomitus squalens (strain LYAD-421) TaxID=732165 RepID=UPI0004414066|nr:MFS general substrate transporter [Dichomitus squalens LYAD-421 SS1]EJF66491.1 MFS general substrate transporter [Dichomitus squalens LYAD-421 SS1]
MQSSNIACDVSTHRTQTPETERATISFPHDISSREKRLQISPPPPRTPEVLLPERSRIRLASAFFALLTLGWGDGVTGTLLPYFERDFNLSFMTSSLLFVASALGYALGTISVEFVTRILGRGRFCASKLPSLFSFPSFRKPEPKPHEKDESIMGFSISRCRFFTMVLASILHSTFFVVMGCKLGFPSMMVAYAISAFSRSFILGARDHNVYVSSTSKRGLGYMYGSWAIGAFGAPLVCQSVIATGIRWANFYFGSLVLSGINTSLITFAFRPTPRELQQDADFAWSLLRSSTSSPDAVSPATTMVSNPHPSPTDSSAPILPAQCTLSLERRRLIRWHLPAYSIALRKPKLWSSAIFSMLYTGSESSTQGFIVIYLLNIRNANPDTVGYVTSGFWGGMAISRFLWGFLGNIVTFPQRKWIVQACMYLLPVTAACMHLLIWFVPSFIENAFSAAVVGLMYGPIYPANLATARDLLPAEVHLVSLAIVAAFGSFGAALFPFIAGTLSTVVGPRTLPYLTVSQCVAMFCLWSFFPSQIPAQL